MLDITTLALARNGRSEAGVELDTTLSKAGKAADAKAVGNALSSLSEEKIAVLQYGDTVVVGNAVDSTVFLEADSGTIVWGGSI